MDASSLGALTCRTRCTIEKAKNTLNNDGNGDCGNFWNTNNDNRHNIPTAMVKSNTHLHHLSNGGHKKAVDLCAFHHQPTMTSTSASSSSTSAFTCTSTPVSTCSCIDFCRLNHFPLDHEEKYFTQSTHAVSLGYDDKFSLLSHPKNHPNLTLTDQITLPTTTMSKDCHHCHHHQSVSSCYHNHSSISNINCNCSSNSQHQKIMPVSISSISFLLKSISRNSLASFLPSASKSPSPPSLAFLVITLFFFITLSTATLASSQALPPSSSSSSSSSSPSPVTSYFPSFTTSNTSINFTHIAIDHATGRLYVGATNWLYQLSSDLNCETSLQTGPVDDSPSCSPEDCSGVDETLIKATKNVNKVLVIDPMSRKLISCGSVHQGSCRLHNLTNIGLAEPLIGVPVAANDENSTTVAFIGPARYTGTSQQSVLYVAASNSKLGPYRDMVPAISSRSLDPSKLFTIIEKSFTDSARVDISYSMRDYYVVKYIHGFSSNSFIYFATVQKRSHFRTLEELGYVSRLARVCSSDASYHTYTEVTLSCVGKDGREYNLLQGASVIKPGTLLASDFGVEEGSEVFIGTFAQSKDHTLLPTSNSAICVFAMDEIERIFTENVHLCYNGSVLTRNMDYIAGNIQDCPQPGKSGNVMNFCSETLKLNGTIPITGRPVMTFPNTILTSVQGVSSGRSTFAFTGTSNGHLKKINLRKSQAQELDDILVDAGHPILSDILTDRSERHLYTASAYKLMKIPIDRCDSFESCRQQKQLQEHVLEQQRRPRPKLATATTVSQRHSSPQQHQQQQQQQPVLRHQPPTTGSLPMSPTVSTSSFIRVTTSTSPFSSSPSLPSTPVIYVVNPLESFASGGRRIFLHGSGFNSATNCKMVLYNFYSAEIINETTCSIMNDTVIQCITPSVKKIFDSLVATTGWTSTAPVSSASDLFDSTTNSLTVRVAFFLDGMQLVKQQPSESALNFKRSNSNTFTSTNGGNELASLVTSYSSGGVSSPFAPRVQQPASLTSGQVSFNSNLQAAAANGLFLFTYYPDPRVFFVFTSPGEEETSIKLYNQQDSLIIDGENLKVAASEADVVVTVGNYLCNLTTMSMKQLVCTPPDSEYIESTSLPPVVVRFGENISYKIGYLRYPHHGKYLSTISSTSSSSSSSTTSSNGSSDSLGLTSSWLFVAIAVFFGVIVVVVLVMWTTRKHGLISRASNSLGRNNRRHITGYNHNINVRRAFGHGLTQANGYHTTGTNYSTNRHYFGTGMRVPPSSIGVFDHQGYYDISSSMTKVPPPPLISSTLKPLPLIPTSILLGSNGQNNHVPNVTGVSLDRMTTNTSTSLSSASTSASNESTSSGGSNFLESSTKLTDIDGHNGNNFGIDSSPSDSAANAIYAEIPEMVNTLERNSMRGQMVVTSSNLLGPCEQRNIPNLLIPFNDTNGNVNGVGPETPLLTLNHHSQQASHLMNHQQVNHFTNGHNGNNCNNSNQFTSGFHHTHLNSTSNGSSSGHMITSCLSPSNGGTNGANVRSSYSPFVNKHQRIQPMSTAVTVKTTTTTSNNGNCNSKSRHGSLLPGSPGIAIQSITTTTATPTATTTVTYNSVPQYEDTFLQGTNVRARMRRPSGTNNNSNNHTNCNNGTTTTDASSCPLVAPASKSSASLLVLDPTAWNY